MALVQMLLMVFATWFLMESASDVTRRIDSNMTRAGFSHL